MVTTYDLVCKPKRYDHITCFCGNGFRGAEGGGGGGYSTLIAPSSKKLEVITTEPFS